MGRFEQLAAMPVEEGPAEREGADLAHAVRTLAMAVDAKDSGTCAHSETVARYAGRLAERMGMDSDDVAALRRVALLHDVGKLGTPDEILTKTGPLTSDEQKVMRMHPVLGAEIVLQRGLPAREAGWILHHHEHIDGGGYPDGLLGRQIPLQSRILLVADAFEAMTSDRPYRKGCSANEAIRELRRHAGTQFDPSVVEFLVDLLAEEAEQAASRPRLKRQPAISGRRLALVA